MTTTEQGPQGGQQPAPVDILVPVYRDLAVTRRCLQALLGSRLRQTDRVIVINDASPDRGLVEYCEELAREQRVTLLSNAHNLGFVRSANTGFAASSEADVLLLNSDTQVANDWLDRLQACAYRQADIGTVTPFSNNATICSYPVFLAANRMPANWDGGELDALFAEANAGQWREIPTAIGFCMYIKRRCLDEVGPFDEERFGQGYGEECDFSMRAATKGWRHAVAADVFVFHEGAVSFADQSPGRKQDADRVMEQLHPTYPGLVRDFIDEDPLAPLRGNVTRLRTQRNPADVGEILSEAEQSAAMLRQQSREERAALSRTEARLREALEHNAWYQSQHESLQQQAFEGREYQRLFAEAQEQARRVDEGVRNLQDLLERRQQDLARALEKAVWFEKKYGESIQLANQRQQKLESVAHEIQSLTQQLADCRQQFSATDAALGEAQRLNIRLNDELQQIKTSRVWRYTAWLRKPRGSS
jgi:GT2 family glycosyltransferase